MSLEIRMPQIATDMTEADIVSWLASPGDRVTRGEVLLEIETEKSTVEIEAPASGVLEEILIPAGATDVTVGTVLGLLVPSDQPDDPHTVEVSSEVPPTGAADADGQPSSTGADRGHASAPDRPGVVAEPAATALARRVADQAGLSLTEVTGTGPHGRITRIDVEQQISNAPGAAAHDASPLRRDGGDPAAASPLEGRADRRASTAGHSVPSAAVSLTARCRVDALITARDRLNEASRESEIQTGHLVVRAVALSLVEIPEADPGRDASLDAPESDVHVAIEVPGAPAPVVSGADTKGMALLASEIDEKVARARAGALAEAETDAVCLAVLDLQTEGVDDVLPALAPPRAGVVSIGVPRSGPVVEGDRIVAGATMSVTLVVDPSRIGQRAAARLLAAIRRRLERPLEMLT